MITVALGERHYSVERPWGDLPDGPGRVTDIAVDSRGHVFVLLRADPLCDPAAPCVIELDPQGRRLAAWGGDLIADGHMLTCGPDGRIYIVDRDRHQVVICRRDGALLSRLGKPSTPGTPFSHPADVDVAADGTIFVADGYGNSRVHAFDVDGRSIASWGTLGSGPGEFLTPHAVLATTDGRVLVADRDNDRVQVFSRDGVLLDIWTDFRRPFDIWADAQGFIHVSDSVPSLSRHTPDGVRIGRCRPVLFGAHGLSGDAAGCLYLAEFTPGRLTRLVPLPRPTGPAGTRVQLERT